MKKIAFIVQRYGLEVNGGAEYYCRTLAEHLTGHYAVEVLSSCALDYVSWANWYTPGTTELNGVTVRRFPTAHERLEADVPRVEFKLKKWASPAERSGLGWFRWAGRALVGKTVRKYSHLWAKYQGPFTPDLIEYLKHHHQDYDALIFITYLYYPTILGLAIAPGKSIFIPTAHDEIPIYLPFFKRVFRLPKAILFLTAAEQRFVHQQFQNQAIYNDVLGGGIDLPAGPPAAVSAGTPGFNDPYLLYIGRIDKAKGCDQLVDFFVRYKTHHPSPLKLILVGQAFMPLPNHPDIVSVGFVDEAVKTSLLQRAKALVIPSQHESLSLVTLESFAQGIPVIANALCEVLKDHIDSSQGGVLYSDYPGFDAAVQTILNAPNPTMGQLARRYIEQYYTWPMVLARFHKAIGVVTGGS